MYQGVFYVIPWVLMNWLKNPFKLEYVYFWNKVFVMSIRVEEITKVYNQQKATPDPGAKRSRADLPIWSEQYTSFGIPPYGTFADYLLTFREVSTILFRDEHCFYNSRALKERGLISKFFNTMETSTDERQTLVYKAKLSEQVIWRGLALPVYLLHFFWCLKMFGRVDSRFAICRPSGSDYRLNDSMKWWPTWRYGSNFLIAEWKCGG